MPFPTYPLSDFVDGVVDTSKLHSEIVALNIASANFLGINTDADSNSLTTVFDATPSGPDQALVDAAIAAHVVVSLEDYKQVKSATVDRRTFELIDEGFTYGGKIFSLSDRAQLRMLGFLESAATIYPVDWNTIDNSSKISILDVAEMLLLATAAFGTIESQTKAGSVLKDTVRAAVDKDAVDAVADIR